MNVSIRRAALVAFSLFLSLLATRYAGSAELRHIEANDRVSESSQTTYLELASQFAPGLANTPAEGGALSVIRHLGGEDWPATIASPSIGSIDRLDLQQDGKPRMLLLFDFGQADDAAESITVLALYDMAGAPRLLDAMNVGLDRETSFMEQPYLELSPEFGMAFVRNSHHNAGEEYLQTSLIGLWAGKLHDVDTVPSYSWMSGDQSVETRPTFAAVKGALAVDATFSIRTTRCDGGCEPDITYPSTTETARARYSWDPASGKFVRPAKAFDKIPLPNMEE